ncbi:lipoma HMGIC fusion partner-like 1 protein isoform X4 [Varroa jacobsoni]|uniref:lipoma HMGIC fusion partner-like 1 protein isoform X4 n=1 Tax=Varroa jacobsoni TaxID=62625 RepID=UPI000BF4582E|nr:lipoma HMGIC fusion partner-like 1 protein isoform X4 [Varroa jacobsoni]
MESGFIPTTVLKLCHCRTPFELSGLCLLARISSKIASVNNGSRATRTMTVPGTKAVLPAATINSSLTNIGVLWAILSLSSAVLSGVGFYLPFWIQGEIFNRTTVYFGSFRRCNYPRLLENGRLEIVLECGRYASFSSIPSAAWRAASVLIGIAASLALLVAFIALIGCFTADAVNSFLAKTLGFIQLVAGLSTTEGRLYKHVTGMKVKYALTESLR